MLAEQNSFQIHRYTNTLTADTSSEQQHQEVDPFNSHIDLL